MFDLLPQVLVTLIPSGSRCSTKSSGSVTVGNNCDVLFGVTLFFKRTKHNVQTRQLQGQWKPTKQVPCFSDQLAFQRLIVVQQQKVKNCFSIRTCTVTVRATANQGNCKSRANLSPTKTSGYLHALIHLPMLKSRTHCAQSEVREVRGTQSQKRSSQRGSRAVRRWPAAGYRTSLRCVQGTLRLSSATEQLSQCTGEVTAETHFISRKSCFPYTVRHEKVSVFRGTQ